MEGFQAVLPQRFGKLLGDLPVAFVEAFTSVNKDNARLFALAGETHFDEAAVAAAAEVPKTKIKAQTK